jgi:uncharacterized protein (DUF302 family)
MKMRIIPSLLASAMLMVGVASAQTVTESSITYTVEEDIEDVIFFVENEIIGRGLKVETVNHVATMLQRTGVDLGATKQIFIEAQVLNFCSAVLSRKVMEIDPNNLSFCPYGIFIYNTPETPNMTTVGLDVYPEGEMKEVEAFIDSIVKEALGID